MVDSTGRGSAGQVTGRPAAPVVHRTARCGLRVTRAQRARLFGLLRSAGDVWCCVLELSSWHRRRQDVPLAAYQDLCRELAAAGPGTFGELDAVGARSVLRRYSDAWFATAKRRIRRGPARTRPGSRAWTWASSTPTRSPDWRVGHLISALRDKAGTAGITVKLVDERGTSSTCPACTRRVPKPAGRNFHCPHCGHSGHRDLVAAANIAARNGGGTIPGLSDGPGITHRRAGKHLPGVHPARRDPRRRPSSRPAARGHRAGTGPPRHANARGVARPDSEESEARRPRRTYGHVH